MILHIMGLMKITSYFLQGSVLCSFFCFVLSKLVLKVRSSSLCLKYCKIYVGFEATYHSLQVAN